MELLEHGIGDGAAHAAPDHADLLLSFRLRRLAQRAHKILQAVPLVQAAQLFRRSSRCLHDDAHRSLFPVIVMDRQRNPLPVFIHPQNDELSRLRLPCYQRRLYLIQNDGRLQRLFPYDSIHSSPSFPVVFLRHMWQLYPSHTLSIF